MQKQKETKKGRPKGQKSYVAVTQVELTKIVKDTKVKSILLSKKFLRSIGVDETKFPDAEPPTIAPSGGRVGRPKKEVTEAKPAKPVAKKKAKSKPKAKKAAPKTSSKNESEEIPMVVTA